MIIWILVIMRGLIWKLLVLLNSLIILIKISQIIELVWVNISLKTIKIVIFLEYLIPFCKIVLIYKIIKLSKLLVVEIKLIWARILNLYVCIDILLDLTRRKHITIKVVHIINIWLIISVLIKGLELIYVLIMTLYRWISILLIVDVQKNLRFVVIKILERIFLCTHFLIY